MGVDLPHLANKAAAKKAWDSILIQLRSEMNRADYQSWVEPIKVLGFSGDQLMLGCANTYGRDWVVSRLGARIRGLLAIVAPGSDLNLSITEE